MAARLGGRKWATCLRGEPVTSSADVSVVVVSLNAAATIGAALDSLVAAREGPATGHLEVILVDGGSQDRTVEHAASRQSRLPGLRILHQTSRGIAAARNEGIRAASSALIGFCDADDAWTSDALPLRLEALQRDAAAWGVTGQVSFVSVEAATPGAPVRRAAGSIHPGYTPGAILLRKAAFERVGPFDESLRIGADGDWILRASQAMGPLLVLPETVLEKGVRAGSLSTDVAAYRREMLLIARRFIRRARPHDRP